MIKNVIPSLAVFLVLACANQTDNKSPHISSNSSEIQSSQEESTSEGSGTIRNRICTSPPAPQNIWKLEPMLKQKGLIKDGMTKQQKEQIIRDYINKKNSAYTQCIKGK
ncbi:hypothetical protein [Kangiella spongicola]|uniref:Lipoprotein n=1 Tax=Kangiella spongicola TaxID=796379 RepID=A0A318D8D7_9GAMM|nr:hypothetical protein [Kangiella spongicola]PXF63127.1 hypothetical protein DL796_06675 [Kangiella spongicola]